MARQGFASADVVDFPPSSFTAYNTSTTKTNLWTPAIWTPILASDMKAGKMYRVNAGGTITTTATPTIIFDMMFGTSATPASNITFGASATVTLGTIPASSPFFVDFVFGIRSLGLAASGATGTGSGVVTVAGSATAASQSIVIGSAVPTTLDQTTAQGVVLAATWGTNSASNSIQCLWATIRSLN